MATARSQLDNSGFRRTTHPQPMSRPDSVAIEVDAGGAAASHFTFLEPLGMVIEKQSRCLIHG
jgi:hypothetical protein